MSQTVNVVVTGNLDGNSAAKLVEELRSILEVRDVALIDLYKDHGSESADVGESGGEAANAVKLSPGQAEQLLGSLNRASSHLAMACMALAPVNNAEGAPLHARVCQVRESLDQLLAALQPAVFFENDPAIYGA